jgi:hypothetical protein
MSAITERDPAHGDAQRVTFVLADDHAVVRTSVASTRRCWRPTWR